MRMKVRKLNTLSTTVVVLSIFIAIMVCAPLLSRADAPVTGVTIVNNSSREIRHVYLSPADQNNWGSDQLGSSVIAAGGGSVTLNVTCDAANIKVITEDHQGCFLYKVVACSQATTWTITNSDTPDCGGAGR
jgi:hypothetical protein